MKSKILWMPFLLEHKWRVIAIICFGVFASYCTLLLPLGIGKYMEIVFGAGGGKTKALHLLGIHLPNSLSIFFLFFFAVLLAKFFSSWAYAFWSSRLGESFVASIRQRLFEYQVQQSVNGVPIDRVSVLMPYGNDVKTMQQLIVKGILGLIKDGIFFIMALYILFSMQTVLTLFVVCMIIFFYLLHRWYNLFHKPLFAEKRKRQASLLNYVARAVNDNNDLPENRKKILIGKAGRLRSVLVKYHLKKSLLGSLTPFMLYMMLAGIMVIIAWGIGPGQLEPGGIITYILLLMTLFPTIRNIIRIEQTWVLGALAAEKFIRSIGEIHSVSEKSAEMTQKTINNSYSLLHSGTHRQQ